MRVNRATYIILVVRAQKRGGVAITTSSDSMRESRYGVAFAFLKAKDDECVCPPPALRCGMAYISYKSSKDGKRTYAVLQESYRDPATGKPKSRYIKTLGRSDGHKRKRGPGVLGQLLGGGLSIAAHAVKGTLPPPGVVTHSVTGQIGDRRSWEPERSVEAIQAKARAAATPDNKPVDLELLDMVRQFEERRAAEKLASVPTSIPTEPVAELADTEDGEVVE